MEMEIEDNLNIRGEYTPKNLSVGLGEIFWCYLGMNVGSE
jgi:hypothetical protein